MHHEATVSGLLSQYPIPVLTHQFLVWSFVQCLSPHLTECSESKCDSLVSCHSPASRTVPVRVDAQRILVV